MKLITLFLLTFLFSITLCFSQSYSLNDFEECKIPEINSKEWFDFNHSTDKEFVFSLELGKIKISKYKYVPFTEYEIPSGNLIGVNMGEFGGGLYYRQKDSTKLFFVNGKNGKDIQPKWRGGLMVPERNPITKVIKDCKLLESGNVQFVFRFNDSIYFLGGLAHMGLNFGNLYSLKYNADSFFISKSLSLQDAPSAMCIDGNLIYIACSKGFYVIDKSLNIKTIFDNLFWYGLYPTSVIVLDKQNVLVTIRGGYVKINPETKKIDLYKAK
ncbi:hypothetical protein [Mucilaginibacter arboris]|uniref:Uncharacterized protein n=1 Tax=Mucilaginibacter arboris TaxID=2682090 RepID=A0A7K1SZB3_9SPHI|nr:hypothetical protein [Mucilaginibacter arboris]MVN22664.1 hypothetical protein [Mucilaginibacter arboris]